MDYHNGEVNSPGGVIRQGVWRGLPNAISTARILAALFLAAVVTQHWLQVFEWLLLAAMLSDVLDGWIARKFHLVTQLGATLDSVADICTSAVGLWGLVVFQHTFVCGHWRALVVLAGLYLSELVASLLRYGKISSFHTVLARWAAFTSGCFVMSLFFWGYHDWLFHLTTALYGIELIEEISLICVLPTWRSDVVGIYWVLRSQEKLF